MDDKARRVIVLAQEEARLLNSQSIGTEHLLLGLIHEGDGLAVMALRSLNITLEDVRRETTELVSGGGSAPSGFLPFTPRAKHVLELSLREALMLGHSWIGCEHILLALIREGEGIASQVLIKLGASLSAVRQEVLRLLSGYSGPTEPPEDFTLNIPKEIGIPTAHEARSIAERGDLTRRALLGWDLESTSGVWLAYHSDWSGWVVFASEIKALRHAVENSMQVKFLEFGADPRGT